MNAFTLIFMFFFSPMTVDSLNLSNKLQDRPVVIYPAGPQKRWRYRCNIGERR